MALLVVEGSNRVTRLPEEVEMNGQLDKWQVLYTKA